jgi:hypothetical protein
MASEIRVNSITNRSGLTTTTWNDEGLNVVGVITATKFVGDVTGDVTGNVTGNLTGNRTGAATQLSTNATGANLTLSGNLGVGGTLTYEDVTRVDSVGLSTFREGLEVGPLAGIALTAYKDGSIRTSGIVTAASYYGSGANLTGISAGAGGDTPLDLNDGVKANFGADDDLRIYAGSGNSFIQHQDTAAGDLYIDAEASNVYIRSGDGSTGAQDAIVCQNNGKIQFKHAGTTMFETSTNGLKITTAGKGIDFSAQTATSASGASMSAEILDHYEEGSFTAKAYQGGSAITLSYHNTHGRYTRVGNMVTVWMWVRASGTTSSTGGMQIGGLPFASASDSYRPSITGRAYGLRNFSSNSGINFWMNGSSSVIEVVTIDGNGLAQASNTNNNVWTGGAEVHATFSYFV